MINILFAIIAPVSSIVLFKFFIKYRVNNLQAIVVNYLGSAAISVLLAQNKFDLTSVPNQPWLYLSVIVGGLFILNFYIIALTAQKISLSIATLSNKISLIIPVVSAFMIFGEEPTYIKIIGVLLAFLAIYLITFNEGKLNINKQFVHLPILVFLVSGLTDTLLNYTQETFFTSSNEMAFFATITFMFSFMFGLIFLLPQIKKVRLKNIIAGGLLSIPNAFGVYFVLKSLNGPIDTTIVFSLLNTGSLLLAVLLGYVLFKETLKPINWLGLGIALITILILSI